MPLKIANENQQTKMVELVEELMRLFALSNTNKNNLHNMEIEKYENQIDELVFDIYMLNNNEISIINKFFEKG